jgi:hypothetical protein
VYWPLEKDKAAVKGLNAVPALPRKISADLFLKLPRVP